MADFERPRFSLAQWVSLNLLLLDQYAEWYKRANEFRLVVGLAAGKARRARMFVHEEQRIVRFLVQLPTAGCAYEADWLKELVIGANDQLALFGHFAIAVDGVLYFEVADEFAPGDVPHAAIERLMNRVVYPSLTLERAMEIGTRQGVSAREAITLAANEQE